VFACLALQSCATPAGKLDKLAQVQGFDRGTIEAAGFKLRVYQNQAAVAGLSAVGGESILHVYLEGDGSPWRHRTFIMADPTPRRPLMLELMKLDRQPAAYLGRPCYNGTSAEAPCQNTLWTSGRYSPAVIDSMAAGLRVLANRQHASELWLFGHSGGGTLAMLLADRLPEVTRVVTIAGNLDIDAWTQHHNYTPLYSSLNPAQQPPLRSGVWQWHLVGRRDSVIPPQLIRSFIMSQPQASGFEFDRFAHGCCWQVIWPNVLDALAHDDPKRVPARQFKYREGLSGASDSQ
jgi:pimeloyl-ACP methyl ester carboxylesterase